MPKLENKTLNTQVPQSSTHHSQTKLFLTITILAITSISTVFSTIWLYSETKTLKEKLASSESDLKVLQNDPALKAKQETLAIIQSVKQLVSLPSDEDPTIATVTDLEKLKDQPFFRNSQLGDKVIIYNSNKIAILYRPIDNKIIEYTPLNPSNEANTDTEGNIAGVNTEKPAKP